MTNKKCIGIIISIIIIASLFFIFNHNSDKESNGVIWSGRQEVEKEYKSSSILVPGFNEIYFCADSLDQIVNLYNPDDNDCTMNFAIIMPDGTTIWEESNIQPGYGLYDIKINKKLEKGVYAGCVLSVRCFKDDLELNGCNITFTMHVQ